MNQMARTASPDSNDAGQQAMRQQALELQQQKAQQMLLPLLLGGMNNPSSGSVL